MCDGFLQTIIREPTSFAAPSKTLGFLDLTFEIREAIYDLLLVNRHYYSQREHPLLISQYRPCFEVGFSAEQLYVYNGNDPWNFASPGYPCSGAVPHLPCELVWHYLCTGLHPAILRTCEKIHTEAAKILYGRNIFRLNLEVEALANRMIIDGNSLSKDHIKALEVAVKELYVFATEEGPDLQSSLEARTHNGEPSPPLSSASSPGLRLAKGDLRAQGGTLKDYTAVPSIIRRLHLTAFLRRIGPLNASYVKRISLKGNTSFSWNFTLPMLTPFFVTHTPRLSDVSFSLETDDLLRCLSDPDWDPSLVMIDEMRNFVEQILSIRHVSCEGIEHLSRLKMPMESGSIILPSNSLQSQLWYSKRIQVIKRFRTIIMECEKRWEEHER
jgi:hypothetical protein